MTITVLEILLGMLLVYCAIMCRALVPALGGQSRSGTHCTGSLVVLGTAVLSYLFAAIFGGALAGALGGLIGRGASRARGRAKPTPAPTPAPSPLPPIAPSPVPGPGGGEGIEPHIGTGSGYTVNLVY